MPNYQTRYESVEANIMDAYEATPKINPSGAETAIIPSDESSQYHDRRCPGSLKRRVGPAVECRTRD